MVGAEAGEKEKTGKKEHQRTGFTCFTAEPDKSYLFKPQEGNWGESHTSLMVPPPHLAWPPHCTLFTAKYGVSSHLVSLV